VRRSEREIRDGQEIRAILARERVVRLGFAVDGEPYVVPVSYGYDAAAHALVFHTAREGRKIDLIARNPRVCFEIEGTTRVQLGRSACDWSLQYESLIGYGRIREAAEPEAKRRALACLMRQHGWDGGGPFEAKSLDAARVWELSIESLTGKRAGQRPTA